MHDAAAQEARPPPCPPTSTIPAMKSPTHHEPTLLEELEMRQNEVLDQLDELNRRVECLLNECLQTRGGAWGGESY